LFIAGPAGRKLYAAVGTTGVRLRTARTTRLSTAVVASSASAISGTQTAVVDPGFSLADGENEVRCESQTADQLHRLSMFICMSFLYHNNNYYYNYNKNVTATTTNAQ